MIWWNFVADHCCNSCPAFAFLADTRCKKLINSSASIQCGLCIQPTETRRKIFFLPNGAISYLVRPVMNEIFQVKNFGTPEEI